MAGRRKSAHAVIDVEATEVQAAALVDPGHEREINERQQLAVATFGDGLPWHPEHYEHEIRSELARGVSAFIRAGRLLTVARECAAHGGWAGMLDRLRMAPRQAQRMMLAARRVAALPNTSRATHLLEAAGSQAKFIEMLSLPDEEFAELATDGKTGALNLDDIAEMTRDELRAAIRESRETIAAKDERATERERRIERLQRDLAKAKRERAEATPDDIAGDLRDEVSRAVMAARVTVLSRAAEVRSVRNAVAELLEHGTATDTDYREFVAGLLQELLTDVRIVRDEHLLRIIDDERS